MTNQYTDAELKLLAASLTASGLVANGEQPSARLIEILVLKKEEFHQLTLKTINYLERS